MLVAVIAGGGVAALTGIALAKTFTLNVAGNASVTDTTGTTTHEAIAVNSKGVAVYRLSGESAHHPLCKSSNGCLKFWFPVTVPSAHSKLSAATGIKGKLGIWHRGFFQVTLAGHPLYTFKLDHNKKAFATGEGIVSFGGTWHVNAARATATAPTTTTTTGMTTGTTTTSTTCAYPPCY
jgi:predicted lipoprotein with Yx(FWY)xxD motif